LGGDAVSLGKLDFFALEVDEGTAPTADVSLLVPGLDLSLTVN